MNLEQMRKNVGRQLRIRPIAQRLENNGSLLPAIDDKWTLDTILSAPSRLRLSNTRTGHFVELEPDNVREYRSPDFIILRCQVSISAYGVRIEPILGQA